MKRFILAVALMAAFGTASAGNDNSGGGCQGNCSGGDGDVTANGGNSTAFGGSAQAGAASNATAGAISGSAAISGSNSSVGDIRNSATGGAGGSSISVSEGGKGGSSYSQGGDASQHQSNIGINGQSQTNTGVNKQGQEQSASSDQTQSQGINSSIGATGSGNATNVGGQSTNVSFRTERNAPPVFLGNVTATVSCAGGVNAGASSQGGSGAFGFTWISADCKQTVVGQNMLAAGKVEMACEIWKQTDGFKRAAKRNPALNEMACK